MQEVGISIRAGGDTYRIRRPNGIWGDGRRRYVIDLPTVIRNKLAALDFCKVNSPLDGVGLKLLGKYYSVTKRTYYFLELTDEEFKQWKEVVQ